MLPGLSGDPPFTGDTPLFFGAALVGEASLSDWIFGCLIGLDSSWSCLLDFVEGFESFVLNLDSWDGAGGPLSVVSIVSFTFLDVTAFVFLRGLLIADFLVDFCDDLMELATSESAGSEALATLEDLTGLLLVAVPLAFFFFGFSYSLSNMLPI